MFTFTDDTRSEIATILEEIAKGGMPHPRNLDAALDALQSVIQLQVDPLYEVISTASVLIDDLFAHEGSEGFSDHTRVYAAAYDKAREALPPT